MLGGLLALAFAAAPLLPAPDRSAAPTPPAGQSAAPAAPRELWIVGETRVAFASVPIIFPLKAGVLNATKHGEVSHDGDNVDNAIEYRSTDQAVFGTIYIYYPGLPHAGLAAAAQDWTIRSNSPTVNGGETGIGPAGGVERVAILTAYSHYRGDLASRAAYLEVGHWLVVIRVSGPESRKTDVNAAMEALLTGIEFGRKTPVHPATPLAIRDCAEPAIQTPAKLLPDTDRVKLAARGVVSLFDGGGNAVTETETGTVTYLPSRVPAELCRAWLQVKGTKMPLLRGADGDAISVDGRTVRILLLSDSGRMLEVDHAKNLGGYVLLYHDLGFTGVLGTYDAIPSDKQLADIIDGTDHDGGRIRVPVRLLPNKPPQLTVPQ
jgi:hypothetical protein